MVPRRYPTSFGGGPKKKGQAIGTSSAAYPTQQAGQFPSTRGNQVSQSSHGCTHRRQCLVWAGGLFFRGSESLTVYAAGSLGPGLRGSVVDRDRFGARTSYRHLVWHADLDRRGL